jgi:hypothetical protein
VDVQIDDVGLAVSAFTNIVAPRAADRRNLAAL